MKKKFPQEIINKKIHSYGFLPKKIFLRRICAGKTIADNYEVNDKSRLKIERDFFNLNMTHG